MFSGCAISALVPKTTTSALHYPYIMIANFFLSVFFAEVLDNIRSGISENSSTDNIILEVNASK